MAVGKTAVRVAITDLKKIKGCFTSLNQELMQVKLAQFEENEVTHPSNVLHAFFSGDFDVSFKASCFRFICAKKLKISNVNLK